MLTLYCFVVVYALTSDDDKRDSKRVQRRPIRISLRGSGRCKELNKSLLNMNRLLIFNSFSARSAWSKSFTVVLLFLDPDCLENETWYLGRTVGSLGRHCFRRMVIIVKPYWMGGHLEIPLPYALKFTQLSLHSWWVKWVPVLLGTSCACNPPLPWVAVDAVSYGRSYRKRRPSGCLRLR